MYSWACAISIMLSAQTAQHQASSAFWGIPYEGFLYDSLIIEVSVSQGRARLIATGFAIYCFVNYLHPAHTLPFSFWRPLVAACSGFGEAGMNDHDSKSWKAGFADGGGTV